MNQKRTFCGWILLFLFFFLLQPFPLHASEADLKIPELSSVRYPVGEGKGLNGAALLYGGLVICLFGMGFGVLQYIQTKKLEVHASMRKVSNVIWETCKTYLLQQGRFLAVLWVLIAICIGYYFLVLRDFPVANVVLILLASILGILGSYGVAWFGIRINTVTNSRSALAPRDSPMANPRKQAQREE